MHEMNGSYGKQQILMVKLGCCRKIELSDVACLVSKTWDAITQEVLQHGFEAALRHGHDKAGQLPQP